MRAGRLSRVLEAEFSAVGDGLRTPEIIWGVPGVGKSKIVGGLCVDGHR